MTSAFVRLLAMVVALAAMTAGAFIFNTGVGIAWLGYLVFDAAKPNVIKVIRR